MLSLLCPQLHHGIQEGEVEAPHLHPRASRRGCDRSVPDKLRVVATAIGILLGRRGDDGLYGRERFREATREEQLGGLAVGFGDLRGLLPGRGERRDGRRQVARAADVVVVQARHISCLKLMMALCDGIEIP